MDLNLKGKVAIVTGAGRGIGRCIANTLGREGASVVIDDIDPEAARLVEGEVKALGARAMAVEADVTSFAGVKQMVGRTLDEFGKIDILINNAGIWYVKGRPVQQKLFENSAEEDWHGFVNITLFGVLHCCKAVLDTMLQQKGGSIVNIVSDAGRQPRGPRITAYGAGKGAIIAFARNLALEVGPSGIRVNCVSPGFVKTSRAEAIESGLEKDPETIKFWHDAMASVERMPLRRAGVPQDIANAAVFLASDASSYVTGQTLSVNAGLFMA